MRHPEAEARLLRHYRPDEVNAARLKMADVPEGAALIDNPVSAAPGMQIENVFVLPGVPAIMRAMFDGLRHRLKGGEPMRARTLSAFTTEGRVAAPLAAVQAAHADVEIGSYPFVRYGRFGVSLVVRGTDGTCVDAAADAVRDLLRDRRRRADRGRCRRAFRLRRATTIMAQTWDPEGYARHAGFVARLGEPLIERLRPRPGERILDLGCGDGALTAALAATGAVGRRRRCVGRAGGCRPRPRPRCAA